MPSPRDVALAVNRRGENGFQEEPADPNDPPPREQDYRANPPNEPTPAAPAANLKGK